MDDNRIFIGKIPQSVSEAEIRSYFAQFGDIDHVQCPFSTKAFKIAFVTYSDTTGRDKAISFSGHNLQNSPLNVVKASPKPQKSFQSSGYGQGTEARVFVGHIPEDVTEEMLQTHFSTFGSLLKCFKPAQGGRSTGKSDPPGYAFVTFSDHKEKHLCLAQEAHVVGGHTLRVMEAKPKPAPGSFGASTPSYGGFGGGFGGASYNPYGLPPPSTGTFVAHGMDETDPKRVFISHIQPSINDAHLRAHFSQFGNITDVFIPQPQPADSSAEDPKGFAYVSFDDSKAVYRTLALPDHSIQGARIDVQEARPKSSRRQAPPARGARQEARVFIGKIPAHITDDIISTHFSQFGEVKEFYRPREQHARDGLAFGFLTYGSIPDLARCLAVSQHVLPDGNLVSVTRARPRPSAGGAAGGAATGATTSGSVPDMSFGGAQQMPMFGQQAYGTPQAYNPYGQQQQQQQRFAAPQQFAAAAAATAVQGQYTPAVPVPQAVGQQQFAPQGQVYGAAPAQPFAMSQGAYGGQMQQAAMQQAAMPQGYGATQPQRTNQRYNPY